MGKFIDMTGQTYGDWTVLGKSKRANNQGTYWICQCKCGTIRPVMGVALRAGRSTGCGCARTEKVRQIMRARGSGAGSAHSRRGLCFNVFCPRRDNYKGAWSCSRCRGCEGRELQRLSKCEVLKI